MDPDVLTFAQVAVVIVGLAGSLTLIGVVAFKVLLQPKRVTPTIDRQQEERLERLQQSVDAIAIEVERIAEAQRFTARLMSESASARAPLSS